MLCDGCNESMQRETIVIVSRARGRMRSIMQPGWYCWTCRTSVHSAGDLSEPETAGRGPRVPRGWPVTPARVGTARAGVAR
jgi:hypothetical protein